MIKATVLICGGGIIGLTIARELLKQGCENIIIIEKENELGKHASGRNSGVLHAGIYYPHESLKAKSCINGNLLMRRYCKERGLPILETGKVIVAKNENEVQTLRGLYQGAIKNGAKVELIDEKQLKEIEPHARTHGIALYSHYTAVVDPKTILKSIQTDITSSGKAKLLTNTEFRRLKGRNTVITNSGEVKFDLFINAAGAYSDKVAHAFGVGLNYKLIPFKGIYKRLKNEKSCLVKGNIYPVPDTRNPFLGVHFTKDIKGNVNIGPTAIPALGRENYGILKGMDLEAIDILYREAILFIMNPQFRKVAITEPRKYIFKYFFENARELVNDLRPEDVMSSEKAGIRPQLVDWKKKGLVMDFLVIKDGDSIHILNTVSPAFTSSMSFSEFVVKEYVN